MLVWYNGCASSFQVDDRSSILLTRSNLRKIYILKLKTILAAAALALSSLAATAQTATQAELVGPFLCTDNAVCSGIPNNQNAYIEVKVFDPAGLKVTVNGISKTYAPGTYSIVTNPVARSFNNYPVITYPDGVLSMYYRLGRSGSYLHSTACPSCVVWQLMHGTIKY